MSRQSYGFIVFLGFLALVLALPGQASDRLPTVQPGPDAGRVTGELFVKSGDLSPVRIIAIDGRNLAAARASIWLPEGKYTLTVQGRIDPRHSNPAPGSALRSGSRRGATGRSDIDVVVEAGKSYFLAMRSDRSDSDNPYTVVLHRVADN